MPGTTPATEFDDIRPYNDAEVAAVVTRVRNDKEFVDALLNLQFSGVPALLQYPIRRLLNHYLRCKTRNIDTVHAFQMLLKPYLERMIQKTTAGYSVSGTENLDPEKAYLFISNHRDIALDPAFLNYALVEHGMDTARIAIGDNLLTKPFVSDLMRLNKSFIVNRSATAPRQILKATRQLSKYIRHSITAEQSRIWIAQREGRAKDGADLTEAAIIKMLLLSKLSKEEPLSKTIQDLHIVPVAISYELDPCDAAKAKELAIIDETGSYEKGEQEDVASIGAGISGEKGRVHIAIGTELVADYETPDEVASVIDAQVVSLYQLHPTNYFAYAMLYGDDSRADVYAEQQGWLMPAMSSQRAMFEARVYALNEAHQPFMLKMYAECLKRKLEYGVL